MCKTTKLLGMALTLTGLALLVAIVFPGQMATANEEASTQIRAATDGVQVNFSARTGREVLIFSVRVTGPDGFFFEDKVEQQDLIEWLPPSELADGTYSWEAWVITADPNAPMRERTPELEARAIDHWFEPEFKQTHLASGTFGVRHNKIGAVDQSQGDDEGDSVTRRVAEAILDFLVPAAHAGQNIDDWVFLLDDQQDDSSVLWLGNDNYPFWSVWHDQGDLRFHGTSDDETIMRLTQDKTILGPSEGIEIKEDQLNVNTSGHSNTNTYLRGDRERVFRVRPDASSTTALVVRDNSSVTVGRVSEGPERGLRVHADAWIGGSTGIGTIAPIAPLHVRRSDNTAQVLVEDTGSGSPQALFKLENNGFPLFQMRDSSQANVDWAFRLAGTQEADERFVITKIGTGGSEMALFHNGDVEIQGSLFQGSSREIKDEITEMDPETVLSRIDRLSIHEWSYKTQGGGRHVGPMAEDFHSLFGLGRDDKTISPGDLAGVALAAAKALQADRLDLRSEFNRRSEALAAQNAELQRENDELRRRLDRMESMLATD